MRLKKALRSFARKIAGVDVRSVQPFDDQFETLVHILRALGSPIVIDVGANKGGFGLDLYRAGWTGRVVSFEPLPDANVELRKAASAHPGWDVITAHAIGDKEEIVQFHVAGNSSSSSMLRMTPLHTDVAPTSATVAKISVHVKRLDSVIEAMGPGARAPLFLKIDTQGSETAVLDGASGIMERVVGIRVEMSFAKLYEGQDLFDALYAKVRALGFEPWDIAPVLRNQKTGRMLQCDTIFVRS
jgi:FkbM family methyltransferase